ncbi:MAG: divalent-cation tolerance protein CutA [Deltaproteobacteria bacterium]|nr:divalent-cation tolerance protein CutA [Deltaproteobacteria bacterium]
MAEVIDALVVYVTAPQERAPELARAVVAAGLAACVNIVPQIRSIYRWKGEVHDEPEALLIIKTTRDGFEALRVGVVALHPYDVPEIIALPLEAGHPAYLAWIQANVGGGDK